MTPTPPAPPRDSQQALGLLRWLLITTFAVLGYLVVSYLAGVLAPILTAFGIAYLLNPLLERLVRRGVGRGLAAGLLLFTGVALVAVVLVVVTPAAAHQLREFVADLPRFFDNLRAWTRVHLGVVLPANWKAYVESSHLRETLGDAFGPVREWAGAALGGVFSLLAVLAELLLVPVFSFYFLSDWPNILGRLDHVVPPRRRATVRAIARDIDQVVAGWVRGQAIVTSLLAILYATGFTVVGMPLSLPIGLVVGLLTVIPFVGTFVGASIAIVVTLASGGGAQMVGMVAVVILCLHLLEAGVLTPKIVGHRVGLSESGALLAVASFRRFAPPHPGFGDLAFNGAGGLQTNTLTAGGTIGFVGATPGQAIAFDFGKPVASGGTVTQFVVIPGGREWGHVAYRFPLGVVPPSRWIAFAPYLLWVFMSLLALVRRLRAWRAARAVMTPRP